MQLLLLLKKFVSYKTVMNTICYCLLLIWCHLQLWLT